MTGLQYLDISGKSWAYQLLDDKFLGSGTFGHVHLAQAAIDGTTVRKIAVKTLNIKGTHDDMETELEKKRKASWEYLFNLDHPNILKYYGAHVTSAPGPRSIALLMEYCSGKRICA
ncbi:hypothetical protein BV898_04108 [Hypsibius exemplaris]|uniref:Protein kinase domain-containing protein n=1 Tax=Hypsibius exemplaris TaxID=2072580 RepID=A0A1W0X329_HYPEX|nr:hypothetical protein BV898_04108 [Hypsibius exemplaris]